MQRLSPRVTNELRARAAARPAGARASASRQVTSGASTIERYINDIYDLGLLTKAQEVELAVRMQVAKEQGDQAAYDQARGEFAQANLRLVISIAKKFATCGVPLSDLVQEGNIGLLSAVQKFDPTLDIKFSTYATWWIKQAVIRAIYTQSRPIRIPINLSEAIYKRNREEAMGGALPPQKLRRPKAKPARAGAKKRVRKRHRLLTEEHREDFRLVVNLSRTPYSLDAPIGDDGGSFSDLFADEHANAAVAEVDRGLLHESLDRLLDDLPPIQQTVLRLRFGLDDEEPRTLEQVARLCDYSRERIRQIEAVALRKLRSSKRGLALRAML